MFDQVCPCFTVVSLQMHAGLQERESIAALLRPLNDRV
jgi:hypothetical protein